MPFLKKVLISVVKVIGYFSLTLLAYGMIAFLLSKITIEGEQSAKDDVTIYLLTNGVHTDIVVPAISSQMDWLEVVKPSHTTSATKQYSYLAISWGDKGFYLDTPTWADLKFSTAFKAALGLSTSAMHTTYYYNMVESENCIKVSISLNQYKRLTEYLKNSFKIKENGDFIHIKTRSNYTTTDAFYEANGRYSLFKTCNSWANTGLKKAGQKAALWTATDTGIFEKYN